MYLDTPVDAEFNGVTLNPEQLTYLKRTLEKIYLAAPHDSSGINLYVERLICLLLCMLRW